MQRLKQEHAAAYDMVAADAHVTASARAPYSTIGGVEHTWRNFNDGCRGEYGLRGLCKKTRSDLEHLNSFRRCHFCAMTGMSTTCEVVSEPELLLSSTRYRLEHLRRIGQRFHLFPQNPSRERRARKLLGRNCLCLQFVTPPKLTNSS